MEVIYIVPTWLNKINDFVFIDTSANYMQSPFGLLPTAILLRVAVVISLNTRKSLILACDYWQLRFRMTWSKTTICTREDARCNVM